MARSHKGAFTSKTSRGALTIAALFLLAACDLLKGGQPSTEKQPSAQENKANAATATPDAKPSVPSPTIGATPHPDPARSVPHPFDSKAAISLIYQDAPLSSWKKMDKNAVGKPIKPPVDALYFQGEYKDLGEAEFYVKATAQHPFTQGGKERLLLLMESAPAVAYDYHGAFVLVGAALFTRVGDRWRLDVAQKEMAENGSFGVGNTGELVQIGPDHYGIRLPDSYANQGLTVLTDSLYDITESGFPLLLDLKTHEDNSGNCSDDPKEREEMMMLACYSYSAKLEFVPGKNPDYHDLKITYTGTDVRSGEVIVKVDREERYTMKDGKYQR